MVRSSRRFISFTGKSILALLHIDTDDQHQAARKHDIPYPTFVLYANRVHNMLGPSPLNGYGVGGTHINILAVDNVIFDCRCKTQG